MRRGIFGSAPRRAEQEARRAAPEAMAEPARFEECLGRASAPRPDGPLIWLHSDVPLAMPPLASLVQRMQEAMPELSALVTAPVPPRAHSDHHPAGPLLHQYPPLDTAGAVDGFLAHWQPDAAVWFDPLVNARLLAASVQRCPVTLLNAREARADLPRTLRPAVPLLSDVWCVNRPGLAWYKAQGLPPGRGLVTGPLRDAPMAPSCNEAEREDVAERLQARPVWLAVHPQGPELEAVLRAQKAAEGIAHRALLILVPQDPDDAPFMADTLRAQGFHVGVRSEMDDPEPSMNIYIADLEEELGLWYRAAPLCFLGGSLTTGKVVSPAGPAALGSALIHGPQGGTDAALLLRMRSEGATRQITAADNLAPAVVDLLAPHKAAELAHNAWAVVTEGADVADKLIEHLSAQLSAEVQG